MVCRGMSEELGLGEIKVIYTLSLIGFFLFNEISLSISLFCCCTFANADFLFILSISVTSASGVNDDFIESSTLSYATIGQKHCALLKRMLIQGRKKRILWIMLIANMIIF